MVEIIRILSTGAPKTGVSRCAQAYQESSGHRADISFVTAPVLRDKVEAGEDGADILIAPVDAIKRFEQAGRTVVGTCSTVGSVKAAVVVRSGAPEPDISTAEALKRALLESGSVVYNTATSGVYIEKLMQRLGVAEAIRDRIVRVPNGAAVMSHLAGSGIENEIGFGQATEIRLHEDRGVTLVGPLPREIENITTYAAAVSSHARAAAAARALVAFMAAPEGRRIFVETGVE